MQPFSILLQLRIRQLVNRLRSLHRESKLKIAVVGGLGFILWAGLFLFFFQSFRFLDRFFTPESQDLRLADPFTPTMMAFFYISLFLMLIFSNAVISYSSLFRSNETKYLITCPIKHETIFLHKYVESLIFSSWAFFVLALPLSLAYGLVIEAGPGFYFSSVCFFGFFSMIPAAIGALLALVVSAMVPAKPTKALVALIAASLAVIVWLVAQILNTTHEGYDSAWVYGILDKIRFVRSEFVPSYWVSKGLESSARGKWLDASYFLGLVASNGLMATLFGIWTARRLYRSAWSKVTDGKDKKRYTSRRWLNLSDRWLTMRLLIDKDFTIFRRDPVQWTQCAILFGLLGIYILNLKTFRFDAESLIWRNSTAFLNLTATSLVLATLTTRFIFPLLSLEGKRFWILGLLPIRRETLLYGKFWYSLAISLTISEVLIVISNLMLSTPMEIRILHGVTVAFICLALSALSVGLSAIYPDLKEDNPSKIVSGFGGTLNLIISLGYVVMVVVLEAVPCHLYFANVIDEPELKFWAGIGISVVVLLTAAMVVIPLWLGVRAIRKMEI